MGAGRVAVVAVAGTVLAPAGLLGLAAPLALSTAAPATPNAPAAESAPPAPPFGAQADPASDLGGPPGPEARADIPPGMLALYTAEAGACPGLPWSVLAGIGKVETDHGRAERVSSAGAEGPMQFMPATWATYGTDANGDGTADPWDPADAVLAAARLLCADGGGSPPGLEGAVWQYNHSNAYVAAVLGWAGQYRAGG